ncbi:MAG: ThuA domain-containing protein [Clostridia bacterium]|nr:ThuA domain-containing protein [Clostridia bacterium]
MKKALIVYGGWQGHDPDGVATVFEEILKSENFEVTVSDTLDSFLGDLTVYDLIVPVWTMGKLEREAEKNVCAAVAAGTGLAGCHGGMCDAFRNSTDWQFMTGAQWVAHPGNDGVTYRVFICDTDSEITRGIKDFEVTSEQYYIHVDPAVRVLATTSFPVAEGHHSPNGRVDIPVVYTKMWGKGRVFYNSLGHTSKIFDDIPEAKELMRRGFLYAAR